MKLVERFIDFTHWPTSRKAALLGCLSTPATVLAAVVNHYSHSTTGHPLIDLTLFDRFVILWATVQVVLALFCLWVAQAWPRARWIGYVYVCVHAPFMIGIGYLYGTMSSPLVMIFPAILILWVMFFDDKIAWAGLAVVLLCYAGFHVFESMGVLPYAPVLLNHSIDAQRSLPWFVAFFLATLILFAFAYSICLLILAARRLQETKLAQARQLLERSNQLIRRYMPTQLVDQIVAGNHHESSKPERRKLTIVFAEIEGFTDTSEELDAQSLAQILNEYLTEMIRIADEFGATVNQLVGDSIMLFFGAPHATNDRDHALRAVRMAMQMQQRMEVLLQRWNQRGFRRHFRIRIGINTGYASVGDFGSLGRKLYSGIGVQTNLAARIQTRCEPGKVLISHTTWALINDEILCNPFGEIEIKGVHYPVRVYEVAGAMPT